MSTTTTESTTPAEPAEGGTTEPDTAGGEFAPDDLENVPADRLAAMLREKRKAEKSLRERLRETEGRLEGLDGTVQAFQRQAFHSAAQRHGALESALADVDAAVPLADVLGDDGTVDKAKVTASLQELRTLRPHYFQSVGASSADHPGGSGESTAPVAAWGDVLAG